MKRLIEYVNKDIQYNILNHFDIATPRLLLVNISTEIIIQQTPDENINSLSILITFIRIIKLLLKLNLTHLKANF